MPSSVVLLYSADLSGGGMADNPKCSGPITRMLIVIINTMSSIAKGKYLTKPSRNRNTLTRNIITTNKNKVMTAPTYTSTKISAKNSACSNNQMADMAKKVSTKNKAP